MRFRPVHDYLLVRQDEQSDIRTKGGLIVPDGNTVFMKGRVVESGPGSYDTNGTLIPMQSSVGDKVLWAGPTAEWMLDGLKHVVIQDRQIVAVLLDE